MVSFKIWQQEMKCAHSIGITDEDMPRTVRFDLWGDHRTMVRQVYPKAAAVVHVSRDGESVVIEDKAGGQRMVIPNRPDVGAI